jgi:hypothetical protein
VNRIRHHAYPASVGGALAEDLWLGRAYSTFPNPSECLARRGLLNQKLGGFKGPAELIGGVLAVASIQSRFPQLDGLVDDQGNRGGC